MAKNINSAAAEMPDTREKRQYRLPMELPFYTQRITEENWQQEAFPSLEEGQSWTMRGCGIASLRMVLDGFGKHCEKQGTMIAKGLAGNAYKDGVGWIHQGLAEMAEAYGIFAKALRQKEADHVQKALEQGYPCMVSVTPFFRGGKQKTDGSIYKKGGHLVPVFGYETKDNLLSAFLVHHPSAWKEDNVANMWVSLADFTASFSGNFICFSETPFLDASS